MAPLEPKSQRAQGKCRKQATKSTAKAKEKTKAKTSIVIIIYIIINIITVTSTTPTTTIITSAQWTWASPCYQQMQTLVPWDAQADSLTSLTYVCMLLLPRLIDLG